MAKDDSTPEVIESAQERKPRRGRGTGRLYRMRHSANWWIQYYVNGRQKREPSHSTNERDAQKLLQRRLGESAAGIHPELRRLKYEDLRDAFVSDYVMNKRKSVHWTKDEKTGELVPRIDTVPRLDKFFAGYKASAIDSDLVRKFIAELQNKGLASGTINRSVTALGTMFRIAMREGKVRNVPYFPKGKEATARQGFFEGNEYRALAASLPDYLKLPLAIGFFTGMREGEILGIVWEQVDFLERVIRLRAGETKNDEGRTVPIIIPELMAQLIAQRAKRQSECPYVCFRVNRKGRAVKIASFRKAWYTACVKVGLGKLEPVINTTTGEPVLLKPRGLRSKPKPKLKFSGKLFHDLRRTGVRNLVRAGVPDRVAMAISGHKTRSVFDRYNITSGNDIIEAGRKLAKFHEENGANSGQVGVEIERAGSAVPVI